MLSPTIERFLESIGSISELMASDAALVEAAEALGDGSPNGTGDVRQKLRFIAELREELALAIARIRSDEALQVLGS